MSGGDRLIEIAAKLTWPVGKTMRRHLEKRLAIVEREVDWTTITDVDLIELERLKGLIPK